MRNWTLEDVGKHWDETEDYDDINKKTYSYFRRFIDGYKLSNFNKIFPKKSIRVLDICCRTGNGSSFFATKRKRCKFICADVSDKMLKICAERLNNEKTNFELKKFETHDLPLKSNQFESVLCFESLEHMPDPYKFAKELYRVLKPKGELILTCPNPNWEFIHWFAAVTGIHHSEGPHEFIHRGKVKKMLLDAGFKIKRFKTTVFIPYGPRPLTKLGEVIEKRFKNIMNYIGLRHIFICGKGERLK